jgi:hypothetical protein
MRECEHTAHSALVGGEPRRGPGRPRLHLIFTDENCAIRYAWALRVTRWKRHLVHLNTSSTLRPGHPETLRTYVYRGLSQDRGNRGQYWAIVMCGTTATTLR